MEHFVRMFKKGTFKQRQILFGRLHLRFYLWTPSAYQDWKTFPVGEFLKESGCQDTRSTDTLILLFWRQKVNKSSLINKYSLMIRWAMKAPLELS